MQVNFYAAARAAAGCSQKELSLAEVGSTGGFTLQALKSFLVSRYSGRTAAGMSFERVLQQCSFLVNGLAAEDHTVLAESDRVDVLPPFAGG